MNGEAIYGTRPWIKYGEGPAADAAAAAMVTAAPRVSRAAPTAKTRAGPLVAGGGLPRKGYTPQDIRFTTHGDTLYAIVMTWPTDGVVITSLAAGKAPAGKIEKVELLGHAGKLEFTQSADGLKVNFPADKPCDYAYVLKITGLKL